MKKPDEIMAEYLLKGGKMLARECPKCGSPLFEYKGETVCVVCAELDREKKGEAAAVHKPADTGSIPPKVPVTGLSSGIRSELEETVRCLCKKAREEPDPRRCYTLMQSIRLGVDTLTSLSQE